MALMLCDLPADQYRVFSGAQPLPQQFKAYSALVHADPQTPDLAELIAEMAGSHAVGLFVWRLNGQSKPSRAVCLAEFSRSQAGCFDGWLKWRRLVS
jgi:hypothetical protein